MSLVSVAGRLYDECDFCGIGWCQGECIDVVDEHGDNFAKTRFPPARAFQDKAIEKLHDGWMAGHKVQMVMAPTGAGKTDLAMRIIAKTLQNGKRAIFCCDRNALINQTSEVAYRYGIPHGVIQAQHWNTRACRFQIASVHTVARRGWPPTDLLIVDEAHVGWGAWKNHVAATPGLRVIGLSATPFTSGLGKIFTHLINATTYDELTRAGVLVPVRPFECIPMDLNGVKVKKGEIDLPSAGERGMKILGDVVAEWVKLGENQKTIAFGCTIAHCNAMAAEFNRAGIMAMVFCADTSETERAEILKEFRKPNSHIKILISVDAIARGFDVPDVVNLIMAKPLQKSLTNYMQMLGRAMRSAPGKTECRLLDHTGNSRLFAEDYCEVYFNGLDNLDMGKKYDQKVRKRTEEKAKACPQCGYKPCGKRCVNCGFRWDRRSDVVHGSGTMKEFSLTSNKPEKRPLTFVDLLGWCRDRPVPYKDGWAWHAYSAMYGVAAAKKLPHSSSITTGSISDETRTLVKNWIARRKIQEKAIEKANQARMVV